MAAHHLWYWPQLDEAAQKHLAWLLARYPAEDSIAWYQRRGYSVAELSDIYRLPETVVEERVSRLRQRWRRWLWGESAVALVLGPFGLLAGLPVLSAVAQAWAIEMGWSYGLDMNDPDQLQYLRRLIHESLLPSLGVPRRWRVSPSRWTHFAYTAAFWGFGPEFDAADRVMASVRSEFRGAWEAHSRRIPCRSPVITVDSR
jgi:hypothetical protein